MKTACAMKKTILKNNVLSILLSVITMYDGVIALSCERNKIKYYCDPLKMGNKQKNNPIVNMNDTPSSS